MVTVQVNCILVIINYEVHIQRFNRKTIEKQLFIRNKQLGCFLSNKRNLISKTAYAPEKMDADGIVSKSGYFIIHIQKSGGNYAHYVSPYQFFFYAEVTISINSRKNNKCVCDIYTTCKAPKC